VDWSIVEVARMSGVTARTLRHYDEIGLLPPAGVGDNGYRRYGQHELLRLQRILVLRALGLGLADIAAVLDRERDEVTALREHHERLVAERDRLARMADTVARTLDELTSGRSSTMTIDRPENLFEGFDPSQYEDEARERWPEEYQQSKRFTDSLSPEDTTRMQQEFTDQMVRMAELRAAGAAVGDERVQGEVDDLFRSVSRMWTPNAEAFAGLGRMYVEDPRFTATYDRVSPGLAEYYRDAMAVYATERLA
jgi:MerR family transcriptional regulator, thiopeptide resistance regulator